MSLRNVDRSAIHGSRTQCEAHSWHLSSRPKGIESTWRRKRWSYGIDLESSSTLWDMTDMYVWCRLSAISTAWKHWYAIAPMGTAAEMTWSIDYSAILNTCHCILGKYQYEHHVCQYTVWSLSYINVIYQQQVQHLLIQWPSRLYPAFFILPASVMIEENKWWMQSGIMGQVWSPDWKTLIQRMMMI